MRGTTFSGPVRMNLLVQLSVVDLYLCIVMSGLVVSSWPLYAEFFCESLPANNLGGVEISTKTYGIYWGLIGFFFVWITACKFNYCCQFHKQEKTKEIWICQLGHHLAIWNLFRLILIGKIVTLFLLEERAFAYENICSDLFHVHCFILFEQLI